MDIFQSVQLPPLPPFDSIPPFNSIQKADTSTSGGGGYKQSEDEVYTNVKQETQEDAYSESSEDDISEIGSFKDYDSYKQRKIIKLGQKIQKMLSKHYRYERTITMEWQSNIRSLIVEFVKMYLHDYHTDMYHHITAILLDCKVMAKQFGYNEEKEFILKGLKMIQEKSLSEGIPAGAGGGPDYWTRDF
jgi:hypothetical protein